MKVTSTTLMSASLGLALLMALALLWIGPTHAVLAPWDTVIHFDESWRIYSGQRPHTDFTNSVGAFVYWLTAVGMHLTQPSAFAIVVGNVIFLALAVGIACFVAYRRLPPLEAFAFTIFVILLASAMTQIGRPAELTGYVEWYNRYGWTLACVFFLQQLFPVRDGLAARPIAEAIVAAVTLSIVVYTKATFGVVCALALVAGIVLNQRWRDRNYMAALIATGAACIAAAWLVMGVNLFAYISDVLSAGGVQTLRRRGGSIYETLKMAAPRVALLGVIWLLLVALPTRAKAMSTREAIRITLFGAGIGLGAVLIAFGNTGEQGEIPLFIVLGLMLWTETRNVQQQRAWVRPLAGAVLLLGLAGPIVMRDAASIGLAASTRAYRAAPVNRFSSPALADFVIPHDTDWVTEYWRSAELPVRINDGVAMLERETPANATVFSLAFSNIFPYALQRPAPRHTSVWFEYGLNFTEHKFPPPEPMFSDAAYVMIPIITENDVYRGGKETLDVLLQDYSDYLQTNYREKARSQYWILLERTTETNAGR